MLNDIEHKVGKAANGRSAKLRNFEFALAPAYQSLINTPRLSAFLEDYGVLSNSKTGELQSLLWGR